MARAGHVEDNSAPAVGAEPGPAVARGAADRVLMVVIALLLIGAVLVAVSLWQRV